MDDCLKNAIEFKCIIIKIDDNMYICRSRIDENIFSRGETEEEAMDCFVKKVIEKKNIDAWQRSVVILNPKTGEYAVGEKENI